MSTQAFTANMESMRRICERALELPDGIEIKFTVADLGSLDACRTRARSTQTTFTSLRARVRVMSANQRKQPHYNIKGHYDGLACQREPLPDNAGWVIRIIHATDLFKDVVFTNPRTGERIGSETDAERDYLTHKLWNNFPHFTPLDYDRLLELIGPSAFHIDVSGFHLERHDCDGRANPLAPPNTLSPSTDPAKAVKLGDLFDEGAEESA